MRFPKSKFIGTFWIWNKQCTDFICSFCFRSIRYNYFKRCMNFFNFYYQRPFSINMRSLIIHGSKHELLMCFVYLTNSICKSKRFSQCDFEF